MLNKIQRKWMKKVLKAVTKADEKKYFIAFEYKKQRKTKLEKLMFPNGYSRSAMLYFIYSPLKEMGDKGTWSSFKEAKNLFENGKDLIDRVYHIKKGIKLLFKYDMLFDNGLSGFGADNTPSWFKIYDEWVFSIDRKNWLESRKEQLAERSKLIEKLTNEEYEKNKFKIVHV